MEKNENRRLARVAKAIQVEIAKSLLSKTRDPRMATIVSITEVEVSPDLSRAKISFSVLGDDAQVRTVERMFESSRGYYQSLIAERLDTRTTPHLTFHYDDRMAKQAHIAGLIDEALAEDRAARRERGDAPDADSAPSAQAGQTDD